VKTYEAIIKGENIPEPGIPESFKVLLKELQSLGLDIRVLREDGTEVEIKEQVDYNDSVFKYELNGRSQGHNKEDKSLGELGYSTQEFNEETGEFETTEDDGIEDSDEFDDSEEFGVEDDFDSADDVDPEDE
jgi:DNA-directed RNA polymerase subunit beta